MWCEDAQRSVRNQNKAGLTCFQFFTLDGVMPLMQLVRKGKDKSSLFEIPVRVGAGAGCLPQKTPTPALRSAPALGFLL